MMIPLNKHRLHQQEPRSRRHQAVGRSIVSSITGKLSKSLAAAFVLSNVIVAFVAFNFGLMARVSLDKVYAPCVPCGRPRENHGSMAKSTTTIPRITKDPFSNLPNETAKKRGNNRSDERELSTPVSTFGHLLDTARPDSLPGAFANNSLYLQGIRLTPCYDQAINDLHVDLFGFPGDLTRLSDSVREWTVCRNVTENFDKTLWGRDEIKENVTLFCQLPGQDLTEMFFMPMSSLDGKQNTCSAFLWRCNVTEMLSRPQLLKHMNSNPSLDALPVHILMQFKGHPKQVTKIATFRIPLETGAVGVGSTIVQGGVVKSYFHQPPIPIGLCVAIYGDRPLAYLRQFVQHHLNVGFPSIVFGMRGPPDGDQLNAARHILARYVDQGVVTLVHYDGPFITEGDAAKLQFYLLCLYHYKGLAKYMATWDIDEFWLPPDELNMNGSHNFPYFTVEGGVFVQPAGAVSATKQGSMVNSSLWSAFPREINDDPLWRKSRYAKSVSITSTMNAIDRYYLEHGCASSFCFHSFPSLSVFMRPGHRADKNRTKRISQDFEQRCGIDDATWQKSIVNTKYAHSVGFHIGGSCFFDRFVNMSLPWAQSEQQFRADSIHDKCKARRFEGNVYGTMHHFFELLGGRYVYCANDNLTRMDEYVSHFASTVEGQVDLYDKAHGWNVSVTAK